MSNDMIEHKGFTMSELQEMSGDVAKSKLFGDLTKEQIFTLMLVAEAEGTHPIQAMMRYNVIKGKPAKNADAILADFQKAGGSVEWLEYSEQKVMGKFSHPQGGSITIHWDKAKADKVKVYEKGKWIPISQKHMYKSWPAQMYRSRCISEGVKAVYPAAMQGVYTPEEVSDFSEPRQRQNVTPQPDTWKKEPMSTEARFIENERATQGKVADHVATEIFKPDPNGGRALPFNQPEVTPQEVEEIDPERARLLNAVQTLERFGEDWEKEHIKTWLAMGGMANQKVTDLSDQDLAKLINSITKERKIRAEEI